MYNLLEYSENYLMKLASLWNYYTDEVNDDTNKNNDAGNKRQLKVYFLSIRQT